MKNKYIGLYPGTSERNPVKLIYCVGGRQVYGGMHPDEQTALELWNNAAYYLNNCGRGFQIELQGPAELTARYSPGSVDIPLPTEKTSELLEWAEKHFPNSSTSTATDAPVAVINVLLTLESALRDAEQSLLSLQSKLGNARSQIMSARKLCDPSITALIKERKTFVEWSQSNPELGRKALEDFDAKHPEIQSL